MSLSKLPSVMLTMCDPTDDWTKAWDIHSGKWYYSNRRRQMSSFAMPCNCRLPLPSYPPWVPSRPSDLPPFWNAGYDVAMNAFYFYSRLCGQQVAHRPPHDLPDVSELPAGWRPQYHVPMKKYFFFWYSEWHKDLG